MTSFYYAAPRFIFLMDQDFGYSFGSQRICGRQIIGVASIQQGRNECHQDNQQVLFAGPVPFEGHFIIFVDGPLSDFPSQVR